VLQEHEITRVGGNQVIKVDFRCVAATNRNLEIMIEDGTFRPDLYYRLNVFHIELPPLRDRREDIPPLVEHFVRKFSLAMNKHITRIAPAAMNQLQQQPWTGNVRELENAVERAMVVAQPPELREQDFIFKSATANGAGKSLDEIERSHILRILDECSNNQSRAAEVLGIDRVTLHHKLKRYGWTRSATEGREKTTREKDAKEKEAAPC
jgi:two-component system, NtrC family, response regulator HydG